MKKAVLFSLIVAIGIGNLSCEKIHQTIPTVVKGKLKVSDGTPLSDYYIIVYSYTEYLEMFTGDWYTILDRKQIKEDGTFYFKFKIEENDKSYGKTKKEYFIGLQKGFVPDVRPNLLPERGEKRRVKLSRINKFKIAL